METGQGSTLCHQCHLSSEVIRLQLERLGWRRQPRGRNDGPPQVFSYADYQGEVGLIMPYEKTFVPVVIGYGFPLLAICTYACLASRASPCAICWRMMTNLLH